MRVALWLMALFGIAVASALFAGNNPGTVTLFWPPYRVDLSLNFVLLAIVLAFVVLHLALRALAGLWSIPQQARRWRLQHKERAMYAAFLDALSHLFSGRYIRSRKAAELVLALEESVQDSEELSQHAARLRIMAHIVAAESAHALQNRSVRESHFQQALAQSELREAQDTREGVQLRAARWAFEDRDATAASHWLDQMPQGAARRTVALRLRFKVARLARQTQTALETARLLTKHRAYSEVAGKSIVLGLALELIRSAHDTVQLQRVWDGLDALERAMPDVALEAAQRWLAHGGVASQSRLWLLPLWEAMEQRSEGLTAAQRVRLVRLLEKGFAQEAPQIDVQWLSRIESAQMAQPRDALLQYLAGATCMHLSLWGKAQQLLKQSVALQTDVSLKADAWRALARLAEQRQDTDAATHAYREALKLTVF
jgi:HemY protein